MITYLIICPLVFLAGFIDAIAGGGGLISLPAYIISGLHVHNAIATNKLSSMMGTTIATAKYIKSSFVPWKYVVPAVLAAFIGSSTGSSIALLVNDRAFKLLMLLIIPFVAYHVIRTKSFSDSAPEITGPKAYLLVVGIALAVGLYDGFYGPGTGTFLILLLTGIVHMKLTSANGLCKIINLTTNVSAFAVFLLHGAVMIKLGLIAGAFNIAGNYLGATLFTRDSARFTRPVILIILTIFFVKIITEFI